MDDNRIILKSDPKVFSEDVDVSELPHNVVVPIPRRPVDYDTQLVKVKRRRKVLKPKETEEEEEEGEEEDGVDEGEWEDYDEDDAEEEEEVFEDFVEEVSLKSVSPTELAETEKEAFLCWRRQLAVMEDEQDMILTPFERNLEFWRQLWRVVELSDIVVQILDGRNPLLFRSADLENYVKSAGKHKKTMILINKADFLDRQTRKNWLKYFGSKVGQKKGGEKQQSRETNQACCALPPAVRCLVGNACLVVYALTTFHLSVHIA